VPAAHLDNYLLSLAISAPFVYGIGLFRSVFGYFNFALGGYFSFALYVTYLLGQGKAAGGMILVPGIAAMALMLHYLLFQPMRRSGASPDRLLIVGLGIYIIFEQFLSIGFGDRIRFGVSSGSALELGISISPDVLLIAGASAIVMAFLLFMRFSETGEAIRALAENESFFKAGFGGGSPREFGVPDHRDGTDSESGTTHQRRARDCGDSSACLRRRGNRQRYLLYVIGLRLRHGFVSVLVKTKPFWPQVVAHRREPGLRRGPRSSCGA